MLSASALFGILMAIAAPNLRVLSAPWTLSTATNRVVADLQGARMRAISRNVRYRVNFTATGWVLQRETAPNVFVADGAVQPLPTGASLGAVTPSNPIFDTRGMLTGAVNVPITVPNAGTRTVTINVLGKTTIS